MTFRFLCLPAAMSVSPGGVGVVGLAEWCVLAGWTDSWLNGWKNTQSQLPACHLRFPERAKPSFQHTLHPLIILPAAVYSLPTQAHCTHTHTHRLDTGLAREIPTHSREKRELVLCSCRISVLAFHYAPSTMLAQPNAQTNKYSPGV